MTNDWVLGIDGKLRRYEIFVNCEWVRLPNSVALRQFASQMKGYRVIEYSPYGEAVSKTFIDP